MGRRSRHRRDSIKPTETLDLLVDTDLPQEARDIASALPFAQIRSLEDRAAALFLGQADIASVTTGHDALGLMLRMECLAAFVHEEGGRIIAAQNIRRDDELCVPEVRCIDIGGETRRILQHGSLFIVLPDERAVVSTCPVFSPSPHFEGTIDVRSNVNADAFLRRWEAYCKQHNFLRGKAFFADGEVIPRCRRYTWDDIFLSEPARETIRLQTEGFLKHRLRLRSLGMKLRRGIILSGPPGTGKTLLGKVLADVLDGVSFMWVSPRHLTAPAAFRQILETAQFVAPCVLFLEDLDLFAGDREDNRWAGLGELMNQLDGATDNRDIITIATTNHVEAVEKALRNRPGRFDRIIELGPMEENCRRRYLRKLVANMEIRDEDFEYLLRSTDGYVGAYIEEIVETLYMHALDAQDERLADELGEVEEEPEIPFADPKVPVTRRQIDAVLAEVQMEKKRPVGFHVA